MRHFVSGGRNPGPSQPKDCQETMASAHFGKLAPPAPRADPRFGSKILGYPDNQLLSGTARGIRPRPASLRPRLPGDSPRTIGGVLRPWSVRNFQLAQTGPRGNST